jgi:hypothetical protein
VPVVIPSVTKPSGKIISGAKDPILDNKHARVAKARVPNRLFLMELSGNFCAQNSFWGLAVKSMVSLPSEKHFTLRHKTQNPRLLTTIILKARDPNRPISKELHPYYEWVDTVVNKQFKISVQFTNPCTCL